MTPSSEKMTNFRPCNKLLRVAGGETHTIQGLGDLVVDFKSGTKSMCMYLKNVAVAPTLRFSLVSISKGVKKGYQFGIDDPGLTMRSKSTGKDILLPPAGDMYLSYGRRIAGN